MYKAKQIDALRLAERGHGVAGGIQPRRTGIGRSRPVPSEAGAQVLVAK